MAGDQRPHTARSSRDSLTCWAWHPLLRKLRAHWTHAGTDPGHTVHSCTSLHTYVPFWRPMALLPPYGLQNMDTKDREQSQQADARETRTTVPTGSFTTNSPVPSRTRGYTEMKPCSSQAKLWLRREQMKRARLYGTLSEETPHKAQEFSQIYCSVLVTGAGGALSSHCITLAVNCTP